MFVLQSEWAAPVNRNPPYMPISVGTAQAESPCIPNNERSHLYVTRVPVNEPHERALQTLKNDYIAAFQRNMRKVLETFLQQSSETGFGFNIKSQELLLLRFALCVLTRSLRWLQGGAC